MSFFHSESFYAWLISGLLAFILIFIVGVRLSWRIMFTRETEDITRPGDTHERRRYTDGSRRCKFVFTFECPLPNRLMGWFFIRRGRR